jgi:hypothetical protein
MKNKSKAAKENDMSQGNAGYKKQNVCWAITSAEQHIGGEAYPVAVA